MPWRAPKRGGARAKVAAALKMLLKSQINQENAGSKRDMSRIKRWMDRRRVVWSEPALPKYIKINPNSPPGAAEGLQPGDMSMLKVAEEFLEEPEEGLALSGPGALPDV